MKKIVRSHALSKTESDYSFSLGEMNIDGEKLQIWYFTIEKELIIKKGNEWMIKQNNIPDQIYINR